MVGIRIGTSGWSYDDWLGPVYPKGLKKSKMLEFYIQLFNTCELNTSFYHIPRMHVIASWARKVPDDFTFSVKIFKGITHDAKLDPRKYGTLLEQYMNRFKPLDSKITAYLLQLPPSFSQDREEHFGYFRAFLKKWIQKYPPEKLVVEFRHLSWMDDEVFQFLKEKGIAYCIVVEPLLPPVLEITNSNLSYIRFHGFGESIWFDYLFKHEEIREWTGKVKEVAKKATDVNVYFNNHFSGYAVQNALELMDFLEIPHPSLPRLRSQHDPQKGQSRLDTFL